MEWFKDLFNKKFRFTKERKLHIKNNHPEMKGQLKKIKNVLLKPDCVVESKTDSQVNLYYKYYKATSVGYKHLCVVTKVLPDDKFIITVYFTDTTKRGKTIWKKKK